MNTLSRTCTLVAAAAGLIAALSAPALSDDGFMAIHMDNQKIGSAVSEYWHARAIVSSAPVPDGFMAIHMANQKDGSAVSIYWNTLVFAASVASVAEDDPKGYQQGGSAEAPYWDSWWRPTTNGLGK